MEQTRYRFGRFLYDPRAGELVSGSEMTRLGPQPARLLNVLLNRAGELVARHELYAELWPETKVEYDLGLNAVVRALRAALGDDPAEPQYVETLRRRGYRFVAEVEVVHQPEAGTRFALFRAPIAATLALLAAGGAAWVFGVPSDGPDSAPHPSLVQARWLLDQQDDDANTRAVRLLATLPEGLGSSARAQALTARAQYQTGGMDAARVSARAALAQNPEDGTALRVLGGVALWRDGDPRRAARLLARAAAADPRSALLAQERGLAAAALGEFDVALAHLRRARDLDPVSPNLTYDGWLVAYLAREYRTSAQWCDDFARLTGSPGTRCRLLTALGQGDRGAASAHAQRILADAGHPDRFAGTRAPEDVLRIFWEWDLEHRPRDHLPPAQQAFGRARALAQLGRVDEALDALEEAARGRAPEMLFAAHLPYLDPVSAHPRFRALLAAPS